MTQEEKRWSEDREKEEEKRKDYGNYEKGKHEYFRRKT
jgi:hypothetical protein